MLHLLASHNAVWALQGYNRTPVETVFVENQGLAMSLCKRVWKIRTRIKSIVAMARSVP